MPVDKPRRGRPATTRQPILTALRNARQPLSAEEVLDTLSRRGFRVHKTTVYRELETLQRQGTVVTVDLRDGQQRFELASLGHHHHLVCTSCRSVTDIRLPEHLRRAEAIIAREKKFTVHEHYLEFFGRCAACNH